MKNPKFRKAYSEPDLAFDTSELIIDLRARHGLTQEKLAKRIGTKQESIARLERGSTLPSLSFLQRIAKSLGYKVIVKLEKL